MVAQILVGFYRVWHGWLHLPGAGWLIKRLAPGIRGLQSYPLPVPGVGTALLDLRDGASIGMVNFSMGELAHDGPLHHCLAKLLKPGNVLWDVGANVGIVSSHFAQPRFQLSSLQAFEPNPVPFKSLQSLFQGHAVARAHNFGLGERQETISMALSNVSSEVGSFVQNQDSSRRISVQIRRGDDVLSELGLPPPNVLKVDVEGFEPSVFAGLAQTIASHRPVIIFEHIWLTDEQIRQLVPKDYLLKFILEDGGLAIDFALRKQSHDAVLLPAEKANCLDSEKA
ncbi:MAG: FkbM family methyltransferase [Verrucomicrobiota bacterium]